MVRTNRIERLKARVDGDVSLSEFVFDFTDRAGKNHLWHEVIRRVWRDGKVVEEKYYLDLHHDNPLSETPKSEAPAKAAPAKTEAPAKAPRSAAKAKPAKTEAPAKAPRSAVKAEAAKTEAPAKATRSAAKAKPAAEASSDQKPASTTSKKATARK
jgi:hypothetical protein